MSEEKKTNPPNQRGWVEPRPLEPPPGIKIIDAMMDQQDKKDRAERELALAKAALAKKWKG
jgi:hypothetical protein